MAVHQVSVLGTPTPVPKGSAAAGGPVWVEIRPSLRRGAVIAGDILAGLGKRRDVAGLGRNEGQDIELAVAWLRAYDITDLVCTEAQRLHPLVLNKLVHWAQAAEVELWLPHRPPVTDLFLKRLSRRKAHPAKLTHVPKPRPGGCTQARRPTLDVTLPASAFHTFRAANQQTLSTAENDKVEQRLHVTAERCLDVLERDGTDAGVVARLLEEILRPAPHDDILTVDVRALQLALWHCDMYVKTDLPTLLNSPERITVDPISADVALTAYRQPHRHLAVELTARQLGSPIYAVSASATHIPIWARSAGAAGP